MLYVGRTGVNGGRFDYVPEVYRLFIFRVPTAHEQCTWTRTGERVPLTNVFTQAVARGSESWGRGAELG